jgi:hypothetical protein
MSAPPRHRLAASLALGLLITTRGLAALGDPSLLAAPGAAEAVGLVTPTHVAPVCVAKEDWPGVLRAAADLQADIERVTGRKPGLLAGTVPASAPTAVLVGTLGRSSLIDGLVNSGKLDAGAIRGQWEAFLIETVKDPVPGIGQALVIAGSDKRGTIYGIYELSQQIGVSPWYWWADVPPVHREVLALKPGRTVHASPSVKYRGIFLNDEAPDLTNWVRANFGDVTPAANPLAPPGVANYGREFYTRLFEVMLRLRANYLWPAMWNNAFNEDDPENARLADEYGIVMGTSHQEPMLRAQKEWDWRYQQTIGTWNYAQHPDLLQQFWREGIRRNRHFESIITMGLRGANDTEMAPGGPEANRALLEQIVAVQRGILREEMDADLTRIPQVWCLYKEVQEFYEHGMRVPEDITLLWAEDNWGNLRRLPTAAERGRPGGAGIYYHFDYHGGPRSYQWLNTNPIPKIWEQMSMAKAYGADRIWIVNVGHFKGYEFPLEFFLSLAWDTGRWGPDDFSRFTRLWAEREFGPGPAGEIAELVARYSKFNGRRKPEMLAPDTYSLTHYREAETVVADYRNLAARAEALARTLPADRHDAFHQLVGFPVKASALINELYLAAGRNALYAKQGRASAGQQAAEVRRLFEEYLGMVEDYHTRMAGGKWNHFMDQPVLGYTTWQDPPENSLMHLTLIEPAVPQWVAPASALGVAVAGAADAVAGEATLPPFDSLNRQHHYIDVFNRARRPVAFTAQAAAPWILLDTTGGTLGPDQRIGVSVDWTKAPAGLAESHVTISWPGSRTVVHVVARNPVEVTRASLQGFADAGGYVSIEPEHYTARADAGDRRWFKVSDYGRTLSGMKAWGPVDAPSATPGQDSPCLEYRMYLFTSGEVEVTAITAPTLNFVPDRGLRYAVSFDDETPQIVTLVPQGYQAQNRNRAWEKSVGDNAHYARSKHRLATPGYHTLKIWMVDPAVVMQKLIVDLGGLKPSYLGPPESYHAPLTGVSLSSSAP